MVTLLYIIYVRAKTAMGILIKPWGTTESIWLSHTNYLRNV
jgi:hypothetical protein